jgi:phage-related baseplate assembly protein
MSRNPEYQFISTDTTTLIAKLISAYELITGSVVRPASPEKLFINWIADVLVQERILNNYTGNQNLPSRAEGENLDSLGELFYIKNRPAAQPAVCTMRFHISAVQVSAVLIPSGTQVTDTGKELVWETTADAYVAIGNTYADVMVQCQTAGIIGNEYAAGQINVIIEPYAYYDHCENITTSDGGSDASTDDEYYELMRASQDAYSDAGAKGGYIYFAKKVSTEIVDVVANTPSPGQVNLYILMNDGAGASTEIKNAVLAACNDDFVRPLTDYVVADDPEPASYNIQFTYYIPNSLSLSAAEVQTAVNAAVDNYVKWQYAKLGRDINPSYLIGLLMQTGIKRLILTQPAFTVLSDGSDNTVPQIATVGTTTITNGGYENE